MTLRRRRSKDMALRCSQLEAPNNSVERQPPNGARERPRILFLGNAYSPLSTACLQALVELGYETIVGFYDPFSKGTWQLLRSRLKSRGWGPVLRKAAHLTQCKTRMALRNMGFRLSRFVCLPELSHTHGLKAIRC